MDADARYPATTRLAKIILLLLAGIPSRTADAPAVSWQ